MPSKAKKDSSHTVTIIGHGMVGHYFCEALLRHRTKKTKLRIRVVGDEKSLPYDRIHLSQALAAPGSQVEELRPADWYQKSDVEFIHGDGVFEIIPSRKQILGRSGKYYAYDSLVLATGAKPRIPNIVGIHSPKVYTYRSLKDLRKIEQSLGGPRSAVVIGGGLLGLEAAYALTQRDCKTTVYEIASWPMPKQLNESAGNHLQESFSRLGIEIKTKKDTVSITPDDDGLILETADGETIRCDLCIIAIGDQANSEFAESCGVNSGVQGGILIDDTLQTSVSDIYAIGSCAMHRGLRYGLVAPGYAMADVLAKRLNGTDALYEGSTLSSRLNVGPVSVSMFGSYLDQGRTSEFRTDAAYRFISLEKGNLQGAISIGSWDHDSALESAVKSRVRIAARSLRQFPSTGDIPEILPDTDSILWPDNAVACSCTGMTCGKLRALVGEGNNTVDSLGSACRAGTVCQSCIPQLKQLTGESTSDEGTEVVAKKHVWMPIMGALAAAIVIAFLTIPGINPTDTVQSTLYRLSRLWNDSLAKQITGFSVAGASALSLVISLRKRVRWFKWGNYNFWRNFHTTLGLTTLIGLFLHTGFSMGDRFNFWLAATFITLNTTGALVAVALSQEHRFAGVRGRQIRFAATAIHMALLWPYVALLGIHVAKVYLY